jgi:hypothetical protein
MKLVLALLAGSLGLSANVFANDLYDNGPNTKSYFMCGCTSADFVGADAKNRDNWYFSNSVSKKTALANAKAGCFSRYGEGARLIGNCKHVALTPAERTRLRNRDFPRAPRRERRYPAGPTQSGSSAIDETIRRNREDELERVLRRARECEMDRNSVRVIPNPNCY